MSSQREWQEIVAFGMTHVSPDKAVRVRELLHSNFPFIQAMDAYHTGKIEPAIAKRRVTTAAKQIEATL